jgi:hypothetical protein
MLVFTRAEWQASVAGVTDGEFDRFLPVGREKRQRRLFGTLRPARRAKARYKITAQLTRN